MTYICLIILYDIHMLFKNIYMLFKNILMLRWTVEAKTSVC